MPIDKYNKETMTRVDFVPTQDFAFAIERDRLLHGRSDDAYQLGLSIDWGYVECDGDASDVFERAIQVMLIINERCLAPQWPSLEEWSTLLPEWFVSACAPERNAEDYEREKREFLALPADEAVALRRKRKSSLSEFTDCLDPAFRLDPHGRKWIWGETELPDENTVIFNIDQMGDPPPGRPPGLSWLFIAAGAIEVDEYY